MDDIVIRRMVLGDVEKVHRIEMEAFPRPWSVRDFEREMTANPCARYLVAETGGEIIAFAGIMYATNLFNTVAKVDLDEVLYDFRLDGKKGE